MKHSSALSSVIAMAVLSLILSGCTMTGSELRGPVHLQKPFWEGAGASLLLVVTDPPAGGIYRNSADSLDRSFWQEAVFQPVRLGPRDAEMLDFLERYHTTMSSAGAVKLFSALFEERGFSVSPGSIDAAAVNRYVGHPRSDSFFWLSLVWPHLGSESFATLRKEWPDQKLVFVVSMLRWGVYPASVELEGTLLDLSSELVLWSDKIVETTKISSGGPSIQRSTREALEYARTEAERKLAAKLRSWKGTTAQMGNWRPKAR